MNIDIQELPDELIWTATMAAALNSPAAAAVLEGIAEKLLKDIDDPEFHDRYKSLENLFTHLKYLVYLLPILFKSTAAPQPWLDVPGLAATPISDPPAVLEPEPHLLAFLLIL